jgi:hypothetical protein
MAQIRADEEGESRERSQAAGVSMAPIRVHRRESF